MVFGHMVIVISACREYFLIAGIYHTSLPLVGNPSRSVGNLKKDYGQAVITQPKTISNAEKKFEEFCI